MDIEGLQKQIIELEKRKIFVQEKNVKLLEEVMMMREIVERKRLEKLNMSDRDKFLSQSMMEN